MLHELSQYSMHRKMMQPADQWICPVLRRVQVNKTEKKTNWSNRLETISMIFRQPTTPQPANSKNYVEVVKAFQVPVTDSKLKRSLDNRLRRSSATCTVLGICSWDGFSPCASFPASNKFTTDHVIPLHFGRRYICR